MLSTPSIIECFQVSEAHRRILYFQDQHQGVLVLGSPSRCLRDFEIDLELVMETCPSLLGCLVTSRPYALNALVYLAMTGYCPFLHSSTEHCIQPDTDRSISETANGPTHLAHTDHIVRKIWS